MQKYFEKIAGERVFLSPMNPDDAAQYAAWLNDPAVAVGLGNYPKMISLPGERKYLDTLPERERDDHDFAIVLREGEEGRLLGNASLMHIDPADGRATLGIFIGDAENRGRGYGAEVIRLLLGYAFRTLRLHNVNLLVNADNAQAIACYEKAGFKEYGRRREAKFHSGRFVDIVYMDILASEFAAQGDSKN